MLEKLMDFSSSLSALMAFAGLTVAHIIPVLVHRTILINTGRAKPSSFTSMRKQGEGTFLGRVSCSHANCVENLPLLTVVILVNHVMNGPDISKDAWRYVAARCGQAILHSTSVSDTVITARFFCFFTSLYLLFIMAYKTMS